MKQTIEKNIFEKFLDEDEKNLYLKRYNTLKSIFEICINDDFEITIEILDKIIETIDKQKNIM